MPPMIEPKDLPALSREELLALVVELQRQIAELRTEIDQLKRGGKRQAAPFSKGTRVAEPKPPGRKPGAGPFRYREAPPPEAITALPVDVKVTLEACPACGGPLEEERVDFAYQTELPERFRPQVTHTRVGLSVRGVWPQGTGPASRSGAGASWGNRPPRGPRVMAAAHALHNGIGIPVRKVSTVLRLLTGVQLTQGTLTQDALRRAAGVVGTVYTQLRAAIPAAPVVYTDDTGWRVGGEPAFLMAFETEAATVYQVRPRHRHEEVQEVIPADDVGVMVTDRGRSYDAQAFNDVRQQKCWRTSSGRSARCWRRKPAGRETSGRDSKRGCKPRCSCGMRTTTVGDRLRDRRQSPAGRAHRSAARPAPEGSGQSTAAQ